MSSSFPHGAKRRRTSSGDAAIVSSDEQFARKLQEAFNNEGGVVNVESEDDDPDLVKESQNGSGLSDLELAKRVQAEWNAVASPPSKNTRAATAAVASSGAPAAPARAPASRKNEQAPPAPPLPSTTTAPPRSAGGPLTRDALTDCQKKALQYADKRASALHKQARGSLRARVGDLGFPPATADKLLAYVKQDTNLLLHIKPQTLQLLVKDRNDFFYKNQFQTGTSSGFLEKGNVSRRRWEDEIFLKHYENAQPVERCKYGCFDYMRSATGV